MPRTEFVASAANPLLKQVRRALGRGELTSDGCCVAETFHLLEEAVRSGCEVPVVIAAQSAQAEVEARVESLRGARIVLVHDRIFRALGSTESAQGVIALVRSPRWSIEQLFGGRSLLIVLDAVQDPGNAGAIVRAAEAFGASGVIFVKGSASPFNSKTVRATAGSLFRVPFVSGLDTAQARAALAQQEIDLYATVPAAAGDARAPSAVDLTRPCALMIGNEARGVSEDLLAGAIKLSIPTAGVESLNAALASGILLYEAWRQRSREL